MDHMFRNGRPANSPRGLSFLLAELEDQYPELPAQWVSIALDQAARAAAVLTNSRDDDGSRLLVAMLARDRLDAQRQRRAAAARRVAGHAASPAA
jgi:hypothetical protein